ncbi:hypothetical protein E2320_014094 [Naja naja]|nr:hypothetical protein E2320_014094 [Naja naja]
MTSGPPRREVGGANPALPVCGVHQAHLLQGQRLLSGKHGPACQGVRIVVALGQRSTAEPAAPAPGKPTGIKGGGLPSLALQGRGSSRGRPPPYHVEALQQHRLLLLVHLDDLALLAGLPATQDLHLQGRGEKGGEWVGGSGRAGCASLPTSGCQLTVSPRKTCQSSSGMGASAGFFLRGAFPARPSSGAQGGVSFSAMASSRVSLMGRRLGKASRAAQTHPRPAAEEGDRPEPPRVLPPVPTAPGFARGARPALTWSAALRSSFPAGRAGTSAGPRCILGFAVLAGGCTGQSYESTERDSREDLAASNCPHPICRALPVCLLAAKRAEERRAWMAAAGLHQWI